MLCTSLTLRNTALHSLYSLAAVCSLWVLPSYFTGGLITAARCSSTWIEYSDSNVPGGTVISSATDVLACRSACVQLPNCTGFDFNPASALSLRCFLVFDGDPLINYGLVKGVTHYERLINCSDTDTVWPSNYDSKLMTRFISLQCWKCSFKVIQGHETPHTTFLLVINSRPTVILYHILQKFIDAVRKGCKSSTRSIKPP